MLPPPNQEASMATQTITVSDLTGKQIPADQHAKITITMRNTTYTLDALDSEVAELTAKGRKTAKRGRPRKTT